MPLWIQFLRLLLDQANVGLVIKEIHLNIYQESFCI